MTSSQSSKKFFTLELAIEFYRLSTKLKLPSHLRDQYLRACSSVALNLSEGSTKPTLADRRKFYFIALGSMRECQTLLRLNGCADLILWQKADYLGACVYKLCQAVK
jgi:four helix bundle protein